MIFVLKGPGPELAERLYAANAAGGGYVVEGGKNTFEEGQIIAQMAVNDAVVHVVTSAYHVPRAYLTIKKAFQTAKIAPVLHVWGVGTVTNVLARQEALKLVDAQKKGHAARWDEP
jgi:hypothetical protein